MNRLALLIAGALVIVLGAALYLARERIIQQPTALKAVSQVATEKAREAATLPAAKPAAEPRTVAAREPERAAAGKAPATQGEPNRRSAAAPVAKEAAEAPRKKAETPPPAPPTFDVVRVEPSGEVVMAGRAAPGAAVEILLDGRAVATVRADAAGEWTFVPDAPLFTGSHQLALRMKADGREIVSTQTLAVSMEPVIRGAAPLVVLSAPDAPSRVLQQPKPAPAAEEKRVAAAPPAPEKTMPEKATSEKAAPEKAAPEEAGPEHKSAAPAPREKAEGSPGEAATGGEQPGGAVDTARAAREEEAATGTVAEAAGGGQRTDEAGMDARTSAEAAAGALAPEAAAGAAMRSGETEGAGRASVPLALRIVDYDESGQIFFTGRASPGAALRLYVDNRHLADVRADDNGDWTWRGETVIAPGRHALRIDRLAADGRVIERIELPFVRADVRAVAEARAAAGQRDLLEKLEREAQASGDAAAAAGEGASGVQASPAGGGAPGDSGPGAAGKGKGGDGVAAAPAQPGAVQEQAPAKEPAPAGQDSSETAVAAVETGAGGMKTMAAPERTGRKEARGGQAATPSAGAETAPAEADAAKPAAAESRPQVGFIVVQPGNNLWNISRVIYGRGVRYTTIYEANRDQIRDPDLIYPGQVFRAPGLPPKKLAINPRRRTPLRPEELEKAPLAVE